MRRLFVTIVLGATLLLASPAQAEPSADDRAVARSLFDDGRNLQKAGDYEAAIPKLEESQRIDPGVGTLFNLADCYEHVGRVASAWAAFSETADLARRAGHEDRERLARERATALVPLVPKVRMHMGPPVPEGLELRYDGKAFGKALLETETNIDPGEHRLQISAPGKTAAELTIRIEKGNLTTQVDLPSLVDAPVAPVALPIAPVEAPPPPEKSGGWQKPVAIGAGAGAIVALGIGTIFGLKASSQWSDAKASCQGVHCDSSGFSGWQDARSSGNISTVGFVAGGVLAAAAVVLFLTAPTEKSAPPAPPVLPVGASRSFWRTP